MGLPAFDTYAYVKRLQEAGFNEKQAAAQAELQAAILSDLVTEKLATKDDLKQLELALKEDLTNLERKVKEDFANLEHKVKEDITRLEHKILQLETRMEGRFNLLYWMMGFLLAMNVTILFKLFLH